MEQFGRDIRPAMHRAAPEQGHCRAPRALCQHAGGHSIARAAGEGFCPCGDLRDSLASIPGGGQRRARETRAPHTRWPSPPDGRSGPATESPTISPGNDPNPRASENCKPAEEWDPHFPDENTQFYLRRLDELSEKFSPLLHPRDFRAIFSAEDLFPFNSKEIVLLVSESGPEATDGPEDRHPQDFVSGSTNRDTKA